VFERTVSLRNEKRNIDQLRLNPDNPRLRHEYFLGNKTLSEKQVDDLIWSKDTTKKLYQAIVGSGGIQNPLYINEAGVVIEGNRRAVVARKLKAKLDSGELQGRDASIALAITENISVKILPVDITVKEIDVLLAREHISGKNPWPAVDQAEHIYRMANQDGFPIETIAEVTERSRPWVYQKLAAYEWTKDYLKNNSKGTTTDYSYFEELHKNKSGLKKIANFDPQDSDDMQHFHSLIAAGKIPMAIQVRKLPQILADKDGKKILETQGVEKAWIAVATKNPQITSPTFQAIVAATDALHKIPRDEYLDIPHDQSKRKLILELQSELTKFVTDLDIK
jgi:hypothetical protein